jgi:hypothetical protein
MGGLCQWEGGYGCLGRESERTRSVSGETTRLQNKLGLVALYYAVSA